MANMGRNDAVSDSHSQPIFTYYITTLQIFAIPLGKGLTDSKYLAGSRSESAPRQLAWGFSSTSFHSQGPEGRGYNTMNNKFRLEKSGFLLQSYLNRY
jgi:hypothetical protein